MGVSGIAQEDCVEGKQKLKKAESRRIREDGRQREGKSDVRGVTEAKGREHVKKGIRTSLVAQWLKLCASTAGPVGSIPGRELRSHMLRGVAKKLKKKKKRIKTSNAAHRRLSGIL